MPLSFKDASKLHFLVIGDIILDEYIHGEIRRMSPEAPVPVVSHINHTYVLGGSANVAANLQSLGASVSLIGCIGSDEKGELTKQLVLEQLRGNHSLIQHTKPTTVKTRIISKGQQLLRMDHENTDELSKYENSQIKSKIQNHLAEHQIDGIIIQDYDKGMLNDALIRFIMETCNSENIPTFVDPKFRNYWSYQNCTLFKPNKKELQESLNKDIQLSDISLHLKITQERLAAKHVICTLAEAGMASYTEGTFLFEPTSRIDVADVSGAGDTTLAMLAICHILNYDTKSKLKLGNIAGRLACLKSGVSTLTRKEVNDFILSIG